MGEKEKKDEGTAGNKGEEKGSGFRSTVGRGRDGDREISQTQRPFFLVTALPSAGNVNEPNIWTKLLGRT